jgi:hypothetical protein
MCLNQYIVHKSSYKDVAYGELLVDRPDVLCSELGVVSNRYRSPRTWLSVHGSVVDVLVVHD